MNRFRSILRRAFAAVILAIAFAAPLGGILRDNEDSPQAVAASHPLSIAAMPLPDHNPLSRSFTQFPGFAAPDHTVCLKCCMAGAPPRDAPSAGTLYADSPTAKVDAATVERFLGKTLADQRRLLLVKQAALKRWDRRDQAHFAVWFGTASPAARQTVQERVEIVLRLNQQYKASNFRAATPSRPGVFAYVYPRDPSHMFLDREFFRADALERAGTLAHEMSHFLGTQDHAYGPALCKSLARRSAALAMQNADNFEFYLEGRR